MHICPGHTLFLHRYMSEAKAAKKGDLFAKRKEKEYGIEEACYQIISKNSRMGKESGYFRGLNRIYRFATQLLYTHVDNYSGCPSYSG